MKRKPKSPSNTCSPSVDDGWRARSALDTLTRADEIRRDTGLMRQVKAEANKQQKAIGRAMGAKRGK